jgi:threonine/homoserine/homoserine lactone efflux protein
MLNPNRAPRPQLTAAMLGYAVADVVGMILLALGLAFLTRGPGIFFKNFPSTSGEAILLTVAGGALMLWSAAQILRQIAHQQDARRAGDADRH